MHDELSIVFDLSGEDRRRLADLCARRALRPEGHIVPDYLADEIIAIFDKLPIHHA